MGFMVSSCLSCKASIGFLREACAQIVKGSARVVKRGIGGRECDGGEKARDTGSIRARVLAKGKNLGWASVAHGRRE
jgi:hypothetical protein